ncbi:MAG TPA: WbqC family protein [Anaerolineales bacterium]|nr:WbqC family protein [Anaerolineales bacterium]
MNVVILQPSYIPWRGYFDQIRRADLFIFYDDVQYDKHGWRNRNQIKTAQGKQWLTIPVHSKGVTEGIAIKDVRIDWSKPWANNHLKALTFAYKKSPYFKEYLPLLESFYQRRDECLADFTIETTILLSRQLGITSTRFLRSSELAGIGGAKTDRLIQTLKHVGANHYISGPSARNYIERERFDEVGITLEYMEFNYPVYPQLYPPFDPYVTIFDLLFMTGEEAPNYLIQERKS